jgi:hypothetical protein
VYFINSKEMREHFYYYMPPSNCMENIFGKTNCYPSPYIPFYVGEYEYPRYPSYYPYEPQPSYLPKDVLLKKFNRK